MKARYECRVRPQNNINDQTPVVVYARSRDEATQRAVDLAWSRGRGSVVVHIDRVEEVRETEESA